MRAESLEDLKMSVDDRKAALITHHNRRTTPELQFKQLKNRLKNKGIDISSTQLAQAMDRYFWRRLETEIAAVYRGFDTKFVLASRDHSFREAFRGPEDVARQCDAMESDKDQPHN